MLKPPFFRLAGLLAGLVVCAGIAAAVPTSSPKAPASYSSTPRPVSAFYADVMAMFSQLMKSLHEAKDAKAVAAAFNKGTQTANAKKLPARYQELSRQYPEFFSDDSGSGDATVNHGWVPPADWLKLSSDLETQMAQFGESAGNLSAFMGTAEVENALDAFGAMMEKFNPGTED